MEQVDGNPEALAVSPLLCFQDAAHEAAAVASMQRRYACNDWKLFAQGVTCLFALFLRLHQAGHWAPGLLAECLMLTVLLLLCLRCNETFIRWRSLLIGAVYTVHSLARRTTAPMVFGPSCPHMATVFLREFNISQAFWLALICTAHPVPLKHAVWSQGVAVASMLAHVPRLHVNAIARCAASGQHFYGAARALTVAAGGVFPGPLGSAILELPQRLGPTGAFYAVHLALLLASYLASLAILARFELAHRRAYARQHRLTAEAAALLHRKRQLAPGLTALLLLCAVGWIASCCAVLLCFKMADLVR